MEFDAEAYAEGICNSAAGSSIETLVDLLKFVCDSVVPDAISGRKRQRKSNEREETIWYYKDVENKFRDLIEAIVQREKDEGEDTFFGEEIDEDEMIETLQSMTEGEMVEFDVFQNHLVERKENGWVVTYEGVKTAWDSAESVVGYIMED